MVQNKLCTLRQKNGFTLLEVVISMAIIGIMSVIIYNGLRLGIKARETGENFEENNQRIRSICSMVLSQIKSARPYFYPDKENPEKKKLAFVGKPDSIQFITSAARLTPGKTNEGIHESTIYLEEQGDQGSGALLLEEAAIHYPDIFESEVEPVVLAEDVTDLHFRYYYTVKDEMGDVEGKWTDHYDEGLFNQESSDDAEGEEGEQNSDESLTRLPTAVEISFTILIPRKDSDRKSVRNLMFPPTIIYIQSGLEGTPVTIPEDELEDIEE